MGILSRSKMLLELENESQNMATQYESTTIIL